MKVRSLVVTMVFCMVGLAMGLAQNPNMGTWQINEAKSKIPAGAMKNVTVVYAAAGDSVKVTTDGLDGAGKPMHTEWTGKFDGKDYPLTGDPVADSRSYKQVDANTLIVEQKKDGKLVTTARIVVAADGKSRVLTTRSKDAAGKEVTGSSTYDKQ